MRNGIFILFFILLDFHYVSAQDFSCSDTLQLHQKLTEIRKRDQGARARIIKDLESKTPEAIRSAALEMKISDRKNQLFIAALLDKCGWPQGLSTIENNTIFLVIDHADTAFMAKYFPMLKTQCDRGVVAKSDYATMQDRMQLRNGQKQTYGTQTFKVGMLVTIWPIEELVSLDSRRRAMGLLPMMDYINLLNQTYKSEIVWDKEMTLEQAKERITGKNLNGNVIH
ncbi:hypothetical protein OQY15_20780 [Pedobacter sp. MC2016-15]|uniref:DUF6624 domain-containing protein n=1 Tax=Pedobacter sp. MC2016-15 TaxID=2994473 RepID=UPI0022456843|nr:DUF6624 domain-containing protein [Pedobacter sp. MC2016-15]MCX2481548.1 hypothetical protein [Pedobacter sp. MC2016-15]